MLLKELNLGHHKYEFSSLAVSLSLEGKASHRELTSRLLSDLTGKLLSQSDMGRAFDKMLKELPDLILDTPEAPQVDLLNDGVRKWQVSVVDLFLSLWLGGTHISEEVQLLTSAKFLVSHTPWKCLNGHKI